VRELQKYQKSDKKKTKKPVDRSSSNSKNTQILSNKSSGTIKIQGIDKKPLLLNLLKKIELKPFDNRSGQYTQRVTDLKIRSDLTNDYKITKGLNYHRTKNGSVNKFDPNILQEKTFDRRKTTKSNKPKDSTRKKDRKGNRFRDDKSMNSKKVQKSCYFIGRCFDER